MARSAEFDEWVGGASEAEIRDMIKTVDKKYKLFLLISLIPIVNFITMGLAIFCYNNLAILKSRGRSTGSDIFRFILMVYAGLFPPIIIVQLCAHIDSLGTKVLGL